MDVLSVGVIVINHRGTIQRTNRAAQRLWGFSRGEAEGQSFRDVLARHADLLDGVLSGEYDRRTERRELAHGAAVVNTTVSVIRDRAGRLIGALQVDRDITELRELEDQLSRCQSMADLGRSAAGMAHEVRKPLNGIKGFASLMRRMAEGGETSTYSSRIMEAANRLDSMLGDILDFARPELTEMGPMDLRQTAARVADFLVAENAHNGRNIPINVDVPDETRLVLGDASKLEQVLLNLAKNGVEAIDGEGQVSIRARRIQKGGVEKVVVKVTDTGKGIPPDRIGDIMEPFASDKEGGAGLGLAMVTKLLRLHGTKPDIQSEPGQGTHVQFILSVAENGGKDA